MAEQINPGMFVEVVVQRTITQEMRVGITVDEEARAQNAESVALEKAIRCGNNGWVVVDAGAPKVAEINAKGPIVYRERRFANRGRQKSTGRPSEA